MLILTYLDLLREEVPLLREEVLLVQAVKEICQSVVIVEHYRHHALKGAILSQELTHTIDTKIVHIKRIEDLKGIAAQRAEIIEMKIFTLGSPRIIIIKIPLLNTTTRIQAQECITHTNTERITNTNSIKGRTSKETIITTILIALMVVIIITITKVIAKILHPENRLIDAERGLKTLKTQNTHRMEIAEMFRISEVNTTKIEAKILLTKVLI